MLFVKILDEVDLLEMVQSAYDMESLGFWSVDV
jgi:hypothetical protein